MIPGDQLRLEVRLEREMRSVAKFSARALVDGQVACEAELMCAYRSIAEDNSGHVLPSGAA